MRARVRFRARRGADAQRPRGRSQQRVPECSAPSVHVARLFRRRGQGQGQVRGPRVPLLVAAQACRESTEVTSRQSALSVCPLGALWGHSKPFLWGVRKGTGPKGTGAKGHFCAYPSLVRDGPPWMRERFSTGVRVLSPGVSAGLDQGRSGPPAVAQAWTSSTAR